MMSDSPDEQVAFTIARMREYALLSASTPELQEDLAEALRMGSGNPLVGIHRFVRDSLRFAEDDATVKSLSGYIPDRESTIETLIAPLDLSTAIRSGLWPAEDCDGFSMYVAALLEAAGIPCSFVTVAADHEEVFRYSHVYVAAYPSKNVRVAIDASHGHHIGWEVPNRFGKIREWPLHPTNNWRLIALLAIIGGAVWLGSRN
jgi:transglutaminase-like putative cysteine protease